MTTPGCRFRHEAEYGERIVLASYPRSGNTMLRKLIEEITGLFTGSDTRGGRAMADMLKSYGLVGESNCTRAAWVIKSHFPERLGWMRFPVRRCILLVRHPINAIDSYFNMQLSACHTLSLDESQYHRFAEIWNDHIETEASVWTDFHEYWLRQKISMLIIRYEDLLEQRERELRRLFDFLYQPVDDFGTEVSTTDWVTQKEFDAAKLRLEQVLARSDSAGIVYKPRKASVRPDYTHYSDVQRASVLRKCHKYLDMFGYGSDYGNGYGVSAAEGVEMSSETVGAEGAADVARVVDACSSEVADGEKGAIQRREAPKALWLNKGVKGTLKVNNGPVVRALTQDDPQGRGFPWKWKIRQIVQLEGKDDAGCVDQREFIRNLEANVSAVAKPSSTTASDAGAMSDS